VAAGPSFGDDADEHVFSYDAIVKKLHGWDIPAYVEQTGGGVATIFVGPLDKEGYTPVAMGPGWFEGPGWTDGRGSTDEFWIGPDQWAVESGLLGITDAQVRPLEYEAKHSDTVESLAGRAATLFHRFSRVWGEHLEAEKRHKDLTPRDWGTFRLRSRSSRARYRRGR
jgi:hypothetical protein